MDSSNMMESSQVSSDIKHKPVIKLDKSKVKLFARKPGTEAANPMKPMKIVKLSS